MNRQQLAALDGVFEANPELEFDRTANLAAEAGHDHWTHPAGADAEPIPELEFDQPATRALNGLSLKKIAAGFACRPRLYLISLVLVHAV